MNLRRRAKLKRHPPQKKYCINGCGIQTRPIGTMTETKRFFDKKEILAAMPQQPPFLFLDKVEIDGEEAVSTYTIKDDEVFFKGHFKGNPVFPGSIMLEALGQLGVFYLLKSNHPSFKCKRINPSKIFFISTQNSRCVRICRPGETFQIRAKVLRIRHPLAQFQATMTVGGEKAAFAEGITLTFDYLPDE